MTIWSVLNPWPATPNGGLVFLFVGLILLATALLAAQEGVLWARAERLMWGVRGLRARETTRRRRQVEEAAAEIASASPDLAGDTRRMVDATVETSELVRLTVPASELFAAASLRRARGLVLLPPSFLEAAPRLLLGLGAVGMAVALIGGLPAGQALSDADAATVGAALRPLAWGLLAGGGLLAFSRFSRGRAEAAVDHLVAWLEQQLGAGESSRGGAGAGAGAGAAGLDRALRAAMQQSNQGLTEVLEQQRAQAQGQQQALAELVALLQQRAAAAPALSPAPAPASAPAPAPTSVVATLDPAALEGWAGKIRDAVEAGMRASRPATREADGFVVAGPAAPAGGGLDPLWLDDLSDRLVQGVSSAVREGLAEVEAGSVRSGGGAGGLERDLGPVLGELRALGAELRHASQRLGDAGAPVARAAESFLAASERIQRAIPQIDGAAESYGRSREALDQSSAVLRQGMEGYLAAGQTVRELVADLREAWRADAASREGWAEGAERIRRLVKDLGGLSVELQQGAARLGEVVTPASAAAVAFQQASAQLGEVLPQMQGTADSYLRSREALDTASAALRQGSAAYVQVSGEVRALVADLHGTQTRQQEALAGWTEAVGGLREAARSLEQSAGKAGSVMAPAAQAAQTFLAAAGRLEGSLPRLEGVSRAYDDSREALVEASAALRTEASGYRAAGALVRQLVEELEAAHEGALERMKAGVDAFGQAQQQSAARWGEATGNIQDVLAALQQTAGHLAAVSDSVARATAPNVEAAHAFQAAASSLQEAVPRIEETARSHARIQSSLEAASATLEAGMAGYQGVVDKAARTLAAGTAGYQAAGAGVERMVASLEARHAGLLQAASAQVEGVLSGPLREASERLAAVGQSQARHLAAWQAASGQLEATLGGLAAGTASARDLAERFREAALPAVASAEAFREAARRLTTLFPQLESSADGYDRINQALASAAGELTRSSEGYREAGARIGELTGELQKTLKLQVLGTREFSEAMDKAAGFVGAIGPASERVERAAAGLHDASERTARVVESIRGSVSTQDQAMAQMRSTAEQVVDAMKRQAGHWGGFLNELERLQGTINQSVEALTTRLPHSIDHTLVHFDAALGEGVARLGGSVERLREAMDDLQERLETLMADPARRR